MLNFWNSIATLRQIEFVVLLTAMIVPVVCGGILLSVRYRIKTLVNKTTVLQGENYEGNVQRLSHMNDALERDLRAAHVELGALRRVTAPRRVTAAQEDLLIEQLRDVKGAPVIISAYAYEDECAAYGSELAAALRKAGWDVDYGKTSMNDFKGVALGNVNRSSGSVPGERQLAQALVDAGIEAHQRQISPDTIAGTLRDGALLLVIGRK